MPTSTNPIHVLIIDSHLLVRAGIRALIESWPRMKVVGEAGSPTEAIALSESEKPHVILLELDLGRAGSGLELLPQLRSSAHEAHIIVLTDTQDSDAHHSAMHLGARGLVLKEHPAEELRKAILHVSKGEVWLDSQLTTSIITKMARTDESQQLDRESAKISLLTRREYELTGLVGDGLSNKEIAKRLFISETTVRHHLTSIFSKLGLSNRLELIIFLFRCKGLRLPSGSLSLDSGRQRRKGHSA